MSGLSITVTGIIIMIEATQQVSEKFQKRGFVLRVEDGQYPQELPFQFTGDRCNRLDAFTEGMEVEIGVNLRGRRWEKKDGSGPSWFATLEAWKIASAGNAPTAQPEPVPNHYNAPSAKKTPPPPSVPMFVESDDDLPF